MKQTYTNLITHLVFSTKARMPMIDQKIKPELLAYMGGIIKNIKGNPLIINGIADHVHLLVQFPPTITIAQIVQTTKINSSRWIHENYPNKQHFAWQTGYGAFSVSRSGVPVVVRYIENQEIHHQKFSLEKELAILLEKHNIKCDENSTYE